MQNASTEIAITWARETPTAFMQEIVLEYKGDTYRVSLWYDDYDGCESDWCDEQGEPIDTPNWAPNDLDLFELAGAWVADPAHSLPDEQPI